jgi:hypothetical protein
MTTLRGFIKEAICWSAFVRGDDGAELNATHVTDQVINARRRDQCFPRLPRREYEILLGDVRHDLDEALDQAFENMVNIDRAIDVAVEAVTEHDADEAQPGSEHAT